MNKIDGFIDISDNLPSPGLEWNLNIDREIAARHGVTVASLGTMVKLVTKGVKVSDYRPDDTCLLYTSPSPRDEKVSRMPSSA